MIRRRLAKQDHGSEVDQSERGATLVLVSLMLLVLMGMAAFAVDLGWLYYRATQAQKAAESAALAGVVYMPPPSGLPWATTTAYGTAIDVAERAGYETTGPTTVTPKPVPGHPNRLEVEVATSEPTFFMKVFGVDTVPILRAATAESLPPLRLGSDEAFLGEDPECDSDPTCPNGTRDTDLWLATNGKRTAKGQGDPFTPECYGPAGGGCTPPPTNFEFRAPSYWYAVDVPASEAGRSLEVQIYDPGHSAGSITGDRDLGGGLNNLDWQVRLFEPDQTPSTPTDNPTLVCPASHFRDDSHAGYDPATTDAWVNICPPRPAQRGVYVIEITAKGNVDMLNAFSLRARIDGSADANVAVYGIGAMSLWTPEAGSSPTFKLVRLDEIYAGTQLLVELWDPGDIGQAGTISFLGSLSGIDCQVRIRDDRGNVVPGMDWQGDDGGGSTCTIDVDPQEHNNQWVDFLFDVPSTYTCAGAACWSTVRYQFGGTTTDRTTWAARINGGPVHLVP